MKFYKRQDCGEILITEDCRPEGWEELVPNTTDASGEKHVPVVEKEGNAVTVKVGSVEHPMLEAHYIVWILLETDRGYQKKSLSPGEKPAARFALTEGETALAAYEYCNLHGLWKAEA